MPKSSSSLIFEMLQLCLLRYISLYSKQCRPTLERTTARNIKASIIKITENVQFCLLEMLQVPCADLKDTSRVLWRCYVGVITTSEAQVHCTGESELRFY